MVVITTTTTTTTKEKVEEEANEKANKVKAKQNTTSKAEKCLKLGLDLTLRLSPTLSQVALPSGTALRDPRDSDAT